MNINESALIESQTVRSQMMSTASDDMASDVLTKVKALVIAVVASGKWITRKQVAEYYEVPVNAIEAAHRRCRDEFDADGVKVLRGKNLTEVYCSLQWSTTASTQVAYSPRAVMRMGFVLKDSPVAAAVRTAVLNAVTSISTSVSQPQQLKQHTAVEYAATIEKIPTLPCSAAIKQLLMDRIGDELCTVKQLAADTSGERWVGVAQKAEELGLPVSEKNRSILGKFVKRQGLVPRREERLCHGQLRTINCYADTPDLERAIRVYFG